MTGTQISYYLLCHRKLWLFTHKIEMEHNSELVALGKFISESTYERKKHEIRIDDVVLDNYDSKNKVIHEVKKTHKMEEAHIWQVKHYINVLREKGVSGVKGQIDYPKLRKTVKVELSKEDIKKLYDIEKEIKIILELEKPPEVINQPYCKKCSYYDLCYV